MSNRQEQIEQRTAHSKVFHNADHSFTRQIYLDAVHYQDEEGSWKDIINRRIPKRRRLSGTKPGNLLLFFVMKNPRLF
ncbi:MAG: hypothetical protein Q4E89_04120 [Eubacteriales bacterium]|nr:hypothetical protein [Eubacteriales bacterium]